VAQRRLRSSESVSVLLFATALQLATIRGLFEPGDDLANGGRPSGLVADCGHWDAPDNHEAWINHGNQSRPAPPRPRAPV
jgi:hypothetical protein